VSPGRVADVRVTPASRLVDDAVPATSGDAEKELAAFELTDAVTRLGEHGVPDEVWDRAAAQFDKAELANLLMANAVINVWNRLAISTKMDLPNV
jgi:alkylhydroperoxidase family enzyme